ncbi:endonuclease/exonuclease/phosphatase family protein [Devosia aurantiaca]|uniref:Endonuclease/exonuclease/phosphatase domain-containing protein n=1 Tax=Devosia aurantiaca TaxID=2714858 RepID=A0A6M1SI35_9HYPH|nr:endonuclease/exonuclease/phosphatase family protein [Devosia aurantiaca]NGP16514.1 hypothetical protein [Devosia aurantiaca]
MISRLAQAALLAAFVVPSVSAEEFRVGTLNITNLHHESGVPLRSGATPRDDVDYERLSAYAASLDLDVVALQEIGSPAAAARIFPADQYHLIFSTDYVVGAEAGADRDIYTAFAVSKAAFPVVPPSRTLSALRLPNIEINGDGQAQDFSVRSGLVLELSAGPRPIELLNVHLKSGCNANSLAPVFDTRQDGRVNNNRYDCRTLLAQTAILENWIEQRHELGHAVLVLGDFNRQLNRPNGVDHMWQMLDDGGPGDLDLVKAPEGLNTVCWPEPHKGFFAETIDFLVYDASLASAVSEVEKVGIPFADDPRYAGQMNARLSDHCPVVASIKLQ